MTPFAPRLRVTPEAAAALGIALGLACAWPSPVEPLDLSGEVSQPEPAQLLTLTLDAERGCWHEEGR